MSVPGIKKRLSTVDICHVYIYSGEAAFPESKAGLFRIFNRVKENFSQSWEIHQLRDLKPERFLEIDTERSILVLPGGHASKYFKALEDDGAALKKWVSDGGKLFAICGSVYLIAKRSIFNGKEKERLGIFPGSAIGPFMEKTAKHHKTAFTASVVKISVKGTEANCYISGGAILGCDDPSLSCVGRIKLIVASNPLKEEVPYKSTVITYNTFGSGQVVCSTVHPENDDSDYCLETLPFNFPHICWSEIKDKLKGSEVARTNLMAQLIGYFSRPQRRSRRLRVHFPLREAAEHGAAAAYVQSDGNSSDSSRCESPLRDADWERFDFGAPAFVAKGPSTHSKCD